MTLRDSARKHSRALMDYLRPPEPGEVSLPVNAAIEIAQRMSLSELLPWRGIQDDGLFLTEAGTPQHPKLRLGFTLRYGPFSRVGIDSEVQIEGLIAAVNVPGATLQFGVLSHPYVKPIFDAWAWARTVGGKGVHSAVSELAEQRRKFLLASAHRYSLLGGWGYHPKDHLYALTVTLPYDGALESASEWSVFTESVKRMRSILVGTFKGMQMDVEPMNGDAFRYLLRSLLNPHLPMEEQAADRAMIGHETGVDALVSRETRMTVRNDGLLWPADVPPLGRERCAQTLRRLSDGGRLSQTELPATHRLAADR